MCATMPGSVFFLNTDAATPQGRHQKGLPRAWERAWLSGWCESRSCLGLGSPVPLLLSLIPAALAELTEREVGTFVVSVPALQGQGLVLGWEDCEADSPSSGCWGGPPRGSGFPGPSAITRD